MCPDEKLTYQNYIRPAFNDRGYYDISRQSAGYRLMLPQNKLYLFQLSKNSTFADLFKD
jgi:hypothetical protein